ncbi:Ohr family peroxiredoxin [Dyella sp.]|uniref:Ohr family peroxiredoxin n=1 Tax=Dyella sp. TaxID=1869338 RepID=UPI003F7CF723
MAIDTVLHTARTLTSGGRNGAAHTLDGRLEIKLTPPGAPGGGANPEQLLAIAWSACLLGALRHAAHARKLVFPASAAVGAEVDLAHGEQGFFLSARFAVSLPGLEDEIAHRLILAARCNCPFTKATAGNMAVSFALA